MHYGVLYELVSNPDPRVEGGSGYETIYELVSNPDPRVEGGSGYETYEVVSTRDSSNGVGFVGCKQTIVLLSEVRT